ncbi:MAG TPA: Pr6Pr family membrane protein [Clostridia bacterium]|nr:Pr6Pr family membrane protein [Clostridia bacterium]
MYIRKEIVARAYALVAVLVCAAGLFLAFRRDGAVRALLSFSVQSGVLGLIFFAFRLLVGRKPCRAGGLLLGIAAFSTVASSTIHFALLRPLEDPSDPANALLCMAVPALAALQYLLFEPKGQLAAWDPVYWMIHPGLYALLNQLRARFAGPDLFQGDYLYFFLDPARVGAEGVWLFALGLALALGFLAFLWQRLDRALYARATYRFKDRSLPGKKG